MKPWTVSRARSREIEGDGELMTKKCPKQKYFVYEVCMLPGCPIRGLYVDSVGDRRAVSNISYSLGWMTINKITEVHVVVESAWGFPISDTYIGCHALGLCL